MTALALKQLGKTYGQHSVLSGIDLQIGSGELMVFVGPSGCGKSTLLRMIAGLEEISSGELWIGERLANQIPAAQRGLAMVFQSYALYPHMTVYQNMAFALSLTRQSGSSVDQAVRAAAQTLQIEHLLERKPKDLSGGQRQRVAIGRAIVRRPGLFLFDEPLSNLDAGLRVQMRLEIARLHRELGATMIYVTHDQIEAMTLGQRIAVFNGGAIVQVGTPLDLYQRPKNRFVAGFLGTPKMNFLTARLHRSGSQNSELQLADGSLLQLPFDSSAATAGQEISLGIRAEHWQPLAPQGESASAASPVLATRVSHIEHLGDSVLVYVSVAGQTDLAAVKLSPQQTLPLIGEVLQLGISASHTHLFDQHGEAFARTGEDA